MNSFACRFVSRERRKDLVGLARGRFHQLVSAPPEGVRGFVRGALSQLILEVDPQANVGDPFEVPRFKQANYAGDLVSLYRPRLIIVAVYFLIR